MVVLGGWAVFYERGTPVHDGCVGFDKALYPPVLEAPRGLWVSGLTGVPRS